jgi:hypothetical protein
MTEYITTEDHVPEDTSGEVSIQVTDQETKEIFETRARIAPTKAELHDPDPLTILRGPHENVEDQWYIEFLDDVRGGGATVDVDTRLLRECMQRSHEESNVLTARSDDLKAMLGYLVENGEFDSISTAMRTLLGDHLSAEYPELVDEYVELRAELERDEVALRLRGRDEE